MIKILIFYYLQPSLFFHKNIIYRNQPTTKIDINTSKFDIILKKKR
jgi:hypothetical protein